MQVNGSETNFHIYFHHDITLYIQIFAKLDLTIKRVMNV